MSVKQAVNIPFSLLFSLSLIGALGASLHWLDGQGRIFLPAPAWQIGLGLSLLWVVLSRVRHGKIPRCSPGVFLLTFFVLLFTDFVTRSFVFFPGSEIRTLVPVLGLFAFFAARAFAPLTQFDDIFSERTLFFFQVLLTLLFLHYADGRLIFSDDHPSFLYRLHLLREHFPQIPFYNTDWNAGYQAREFFPSGVLNVFYFTAPFLYWLPSLGTLDGAALYTYFIPYLYIFIVPLSVYAAGRLLTGERSVGCLAAILSLAPSMGFFEWLLKYGTLGFALAAGLVPLTFALAVRLVSRDTGCKWSEVLALLVVSFLCLQWSLTALIFIPLMLSVVFKLWFWRSRKWAQVLVFLLLACMLNLPWVLTFLRESRVLHFLSGNSLPGVAAQSFDGAHVLDAASGVQGRLWQLTLAAVEHLRPLVAKINPLLLLMALPGLAMLSGLGTGAVFFWTLVWLFLLAAFGGEIKPQLELRRMVIPAAFLMCVPAAAALIDLLKVSAQKIRGYTLPADFFGVLANTVLGGIVFGAVLLSPIVAAVTYLNRSSERFVFAPAELPVLSEAIKNSPGSGRVFFLGFVLQDLGADNYSAQNGGHIAPLAAFTGRELYASDFYHRYWTTVDPIPKVYRDRGEEGVEEFLDLLNVGTVVTFKREWADYCMKHPQYQQTAQAGRFRVFTRKLESPGYVYRGAAEIERTKRGLKVTPHSKRVVLRYRYLPQLKVDPQSGWELFPMLVFKEDVGGGRTQDFSFIGLRRIKGQVAIDAAVEVGF